MRFPKRLKLSAILGLSFLESGRVLLGLIRERPLLLGLVRLFAALQRLGQDAIVFLALARQHPAELALLFESHGADLAGDFLSNGATRAGTDAGRCGLLELGLDVPFAIGDGDRVFRIPLLQFLGVSIDERRHELLLERLSVPGEILLAGEDHLGVLLS